MARARPSTSGTLTDGAAIGPGGSVFKLIALRARLTAQSNEVWDTTTDQDQANAASTVSWPYWDKTLVFAGVMVGGSVLGFQSLGVTDAGVPVTITHQNGHTIAGNLLLLSCVFDQSRRSAHIPVVLVGRCVGPWTEEHA